MMGIETWAKKVREGQDERRHRANMIFLGGTRRVVQRAGGSASGV